MDQALRVDLAPLTRTLLLDAQRAVRSELRPTTVRHTPVPDLADPPPRRDPIQPKPVPADQHSAARRKLAAGFRSDKTRALFLRACEQGWQPAITGTGHAKLISPDGKALVLSLTNTGGRGFGNAKATAKRMGLDVSGL